jgi:Arc-like DNA binding domain
MPPEMHQQLKAAADKRGRSLTQEMLWRLRKSLSQNREDRRDRATRAYCFLISEIIDRLRLSAREGEWHRNPFTFRAFRLGVAKLLEELEPTGEIQSLYAELKPGSVYERWLFDSFRTPETAADMAALGVLRELLNPSPLKEHLREHWKIGLREIGEQQFPGRPDVVEEVIEGIENRLYGMSDVRRDLGIDKPRESRCEK